MSLHPPGLYEALVLIGLGFGLQDPRRLAEAMFAVILGAGNVYRLLYLVRIYGSWHMNPVGAGGHVG